ncbi:CBL-interacting serine/threonine-protein kinase 10-like [Lotus japonicus]|uniref:CBL-interacting serine/threonine-protein kinase 10-like n=1 Tax=Lotus japonicus TaxID=34305 RepID=UPI0025828BAA|nr:CBL-interacting serine/threonine-protein kinase 10-like [Lotus japonicus]XP_057442150.1 CBL-interacting serine/threonine-protein kinase 10-like [Lotus japonicus]XP_057442151.1 CBL-interacting serine/threonine-protein kinase 10-like [Lotus japonicus]XP_057442152.1 CBL-interacting serine/threonine-protein kinase 10-like [Lotus japonicus]
MENPSKILMQKYELGRLLGQGTFAKVYYGRSTITNQSVAVKVVDKDKVIRTGQVDNIKREVSIMRLVKHPNIIELFEVMATKAKIYFVMEYAKGGELFKKVAKGKLKEDVAHKYFKQLISAVDFCHSRGVYHRDIKPENILLDENENLKVSDFGLSALAETKRQDRLLHTTCGTPSYVAPEIIKRKGYDGAKADIWSCGVVLFVLLAGYAPFHDPNLMEMYRKISKAEFTFPHWFPKDVRRLLCKMLDPNPDTRISIAKIMQCSWFKKGPKSNCRQKKHEGGNKTVETNHSDQRDESEDGVAVEETRQESIVPVSINAFDIISLSSGFNLCGFFEDSIQKREARFTSRQPASVIISRLEEMAKRLKLKINKRASGLLKLEGSDEGRKGVLSIDAEIFEVTPSFHLVEVKKSNGDTLEYQRILKEEVRPALKDIVWVWQGDHQQEQYQHSLQQQIHEEQQHQSQ